MDLRRVLTAKPEGSLDLRIIRDKQEKTLTVQIEKGTKSWLLEPDQFGEADVRLALAPLAIKIPKMKLVPAAVALPKLALTPIVIRPSKIKLAPMAFPSFKLDLKQMKLEMPKIKIPPVNVLVVPRRIVL